MRYVLSHSIIASEMARVQIEEMERLHKRNRLTLLVDGWEDKLKRSLYGTIASEVKQYPVVLGLEDVTGQRGSSEKVLAVVENGMKSMGIEDGKLIIATTTDDPTVMQKFRRLFKEKYYWVLVRR